MKTAILGASKGMGRALARVRAERGDDLVLLGRDVEELERSAADLRVRSRGAVTVIACDLDAPDGFPAVIEALFAGGARLDNLVITAAHFGTQDELEADPVRARRLLTANLANTIELCERARVALLAQGGGTLCLFSSVAGDRGLARDDAGGVCRRFGHLYVHLFPGGRGGRCLDRTRANGDHR